MIGRTLFLILLALAGPAPAYAAWPPAAPRAIVYDTPAAAAQLQLQLGEDGWVQQQPSVRVLAPERQAWKVTTRRATASTPSLQGLSAEQMADLLQSRITRSGGKLVFIDELDDVAVRTLAPPLAGALALLAERRTPDGGSFAERVHVYLGPPRALLADSASPAWDVLARAGGIWLQAYISTRPYVDAEWAVWPGLVRGELAARGVPDARLRLLLTGAGDWTNSARACIWRTGGVGVWRAGEQAPAFAIGWERVFRSGGDPCTEPPVPSDAQRADLARLRDLAGGVTLDGARITPRAIWAGLQGEVCFGDLPAAYGPQTTLRIRGAGVSQSIPVDGSGETCAMLRPPEVGELELELVAPLDRLWQEGVIWNPELGPLRAAVVRNPATPRLQAPVRLDPRARRLLIARPVPAPARLDLMVRGREAVRAAGRDPRRWLAVSVRVRSAAGAPVPRQSVSLRGGAIRTRVVTNDRGVATALVRRGAARRLQGALVRAPAIRSQVRLPARSR